jgi:hypothetical protein
LSTGRSYWKLPKDKSGNKKANKVSKEPKLKKGIDYGDDIPVIYSYTRAQAIADGVLVDVTGTAKEAGFKHPTVVTEALWNVIYNVPQGFDWESPTGRLWDVLWMARCEAVRQTAKSRITFSLVLHKPGDNPDVDSDHAAAHQRLTELVCDCGPGDKGEPVITIGFQEDF